MSTFANPLTEYSPQMESFEFDPETGFSSESGETVFNEDELMELASEFLAVNNEQELDQFLGDLIKKAGHAIGSVVKSPVGQAIGGVLKSVAKKALPIAGGALGGFVGGPIGAQIGSGLASMAGQAFGLELEGLSQEDREFEATKQFVKFAGEAVKNVLENSGAQEIKSAAQAGAAALAAATAAAQQHAPGLISQSGSGQQKRNRTGRWARHHGTIVLYGV